MTAEHAPADSQLLLRLLEPANRADPYPLYSQIRERGPMVLAERNLVVFASYDACDEVLRHPSSCSDRLKSTVAQRAVAAGAQPRPFGEPGFLFLDPPDHTRLRKLAQKAFAPKVVRDLEPDITAMVDGLLDAAAARGETLDVVADLAYPLPVAVICRLLGVPVEDEPRFSRASALLAQGLDPFRAACAGAWLHGMAGQRCAARLGQAGVVASDLLLEVPLAQRALRTGTTLTA